MAHKHEVLPPHHTFIVRPHLPCKTNTTANIAIFDNSFKTSTPFIDTGINETL